MPWHCQIHLWLAPRTELPWGEPGFYSWHHVAVKGRAHGCLEQKFLSRCQCFVPTWNHSSDGMPDLLDILVALRASSRGSPHGLPEWG